MTRSERLVLVDHDDPGLPVVEQCRLLKVARSTLYYRPVPLRSDDLAVMRRMDELHLAWPFYGSRRLAAVLRRDGWAVNRKRVKRLMRVMAIEAIYQKPNTSRGHPGHEVYPYLLRGLVIDRPNQVWCADLTYIPMAKGFVYLVAVMDWFSPRLRRGRLGFWRGDCPSLWTRGFALRRCERRWIGMGNRRSSTPTRAFSSPARGSWLNCRPGACESAWTAGDGIWTTSSSSGCGGACNTRRCSRS